MIWLGLDALRVWKSTVDGRSPFWNSGAAHINYALPKEVWNVLGLVSVPDTKN